MTYTTALQRVKASWFRCSTGTELSNSWDGNVDVDDGRSISSKVVGFQMCSYCFWSEGNSARPGQPEQYFLMSWLWLTKAFICFPCLYCSNAVYSARILICYRAYSAGFTNFILGRIINCPELIAMKILTSVKLNCLLLFNMLHFYFFKETTLV